MKSRRVRSILWFTLCFASVALLELHLVKANASRDSSRDLQCTVKGKIEIPQNAHTKKIETGAYCWRTSPLELISQNCLKQKCLAKKFYDLEAPEFSQIGSPGARLCNRAPGGRAQVIWFATLQGRERISRCYFEKDKSFVDLDTFSRMQSM